MLYPVSTEEEQLPFFTEVFLKGELSELKDSFLREWEQLNENENQDEIENITIKREGGFIIH